MASSSGARRRSSQSQPEKIPCVQFEMLSPAGPTLAHHTGCIINNVLYIHGGIDKKLSKDPLDKIYRLELEGSRLWQEVRAPGSPTLSHHACVVLHDRYMVLVGGWDGKVRTTQIYAYDTQEDRWIPLTVSGFPEGGGLSSHTATLLSNGDILVCGRDGSTRTHRRHGDAYTLTGSMSSGVFHYKKQAMGLESRSGHTAHILGSTLYIIGGRSDKTIEMHGGMKSGSPTCGVMPRFVALTSSIKPMAKPPCGRKQHVSVSGAGALFIHGGETFDGRSRDPVGEMYLVTVKPTQQWYNLGNSEFGRAGHLCCSDHDKIVIHGGEGARGIIHSDTYILQV